MPKLTAISSDYPAFRKKVEETPFCLVIICSMFIFSGCSVGVGTYSHNSSPKEDIAFSIEKGLFIPNRYHLVIKNHSQRTVEFVTWHDAQKSSYFIVAKNGAFVPIEVQVGFKGRCWVFPGYSDSISFDIPKHLMKNAESIVFKGSTYISKIENSFQSVEDEKEIIVTYDVATKKVMAKDGQQIVRKIQLKFLNSGPTPGGYGQPLNKDDFSLRGGAQQGPPFFKPGE